MNVKQAKVAAKEMTNDQLTASYWALKAKQANMGLAALTASCRVSDKLFAEMRRRGLPTVKAK